MRTSRILLPLLALLPLAVPAAAQEEFEQISEHFFYQRSPGDILGGSVVMMGLGEARRAPYLIFRCDDDRLDVALGVNEPDVDGRARFSWRFDRLSPDSALLTQDLAAPTIRLLPQREVPEFARQAYESAWLVLRATTARGETRTYAYDLNASVQAFSRLRCIRMMATATTPRWTKRRPPAPMPPEARAAGATAPAADGRAGRGAVARPVTLRNAAEGLRLIERHYPPTLRAAGVEGEVIVEVTLDRGGRVTNVAISRSTHDDFSAAARQVAQRLRFSEPAAAGERHRVRMYFGGRGRTQIDMVRR